MTSHLILLNPHAGTSGQAEPIRDWARDRGHELVETESAEDAHQRAAAAATAERTVLVAGGDGSVHGVVNGLLGSGASAPRFGVLPLGTGNDLVRSLGLPEDIEDILVAYDAQRYHPLDAFQITLGESSHFGINVASIGLGGRLAEAVTSEKKERWGPLAYVLEGFTQATEAEAFPLTLEVDGRRLDESALGLLVANGRYAAGGFDVAPQARVDDGLLDVVVVKPEGFVDRALVATKLLAGDYTDSDSVLCLRCRQVEITPPPGMKFNVDGEPGAGGPGAGGVCRIEVRPAALRVLVQPGV